MTELLVGSAWNDGERVVTVVVPVFPVGRPDLSLLLLL